MVTNELIYLSATEIAAGIRRGDFSAAEITEAHIDRIRQVNPSLNALVFDTFDRARVDARRVDRIMSEKGPLGPLGGVPITIKEQLGVAGTPSSYGIPAQSTYRSINDDPLVQRLRAAGAIILGKTNVAQLLAYMESDNPVYGRTNNPWNLDRTPGGSSGGEAAIIAAGGSALGIGSDLGGSIREPAHFCGIHGFKPTSYRLPWGDRPGIFAPGQTAIVQQFGPMARSVDDLKLMMEVLAAPGLERIDPALAPVAWPDPDDVDLTTLRVGLCVDDEYFPVSPAIRRVVRAAGSALAGRGVRVELCSPPPTREALRLFFSILSADACRSYRDSLGGDRPVKQIRPLLSAAALPGSVRGLVGELLKWAGQSRLGFVVDTLGGRSTAHYWKLVEELQQFRREYFQFINTRKFDAILCPPTSLPALRHGSTADLVDYDGLARVFNVLGYPAGVVGAGRVQPGEESDRNVGREISEKAARAVENGSTGLPVGVQVAGLPWRDDVVLALMGALEGYFQTRDDFPGRPSFPFRAKAVVGE